VDDVEDVGGDVEDDPWVDEVNGVDDVIDEVDDVNLDEDEESEVEDDS